jgi:type II secretory pathway pseudopilin PulG
MKNRKGFALIGLLLALSIIGLLALIGLRVYDDDQQVKGKNVVVQEKAKNVIVKANVKTIQSLIQVELIDKDINRDDAVYIAQNAGLYNPFNEVAMNTPEWFPENANAPGEIQITLIAGTFYIQGYGADGLLPEILTVTR